MNHILRTARVATFLAERLKNTGVEIDPQIVLNTILVSHSGRRQWDEARWYPDSVANSAEKVEKGDHGIGVELIKNAGISSTIIDNVASSSPFSNGDPYVTLDTLEKQAVMYADYRTSQHVMSLDERFHDLQRVVDDGRITQAQLEELKLWAVDIETQIFSHFKSEEKGTLLDTGDITDEYPKEPGWEKYIRRLYVQDAEQGIFDKLAKFEERIVSASSEEEADAIEEEVAATFPEEKWWGKYIRNLYIQQSGPNLETDAHGNIGTERAIAFFSSLDIGDIYDDSLYNQLNQN